ncbi:MAG: sensor histidine kinase [Granulosicoccus sp.]
MRIVTQLRIALLLILILGISSAVLAVWNLQQSRSHFARITVSHSIYESYLMLESHTYQLFKQYGDAIIIGDANQRAGKKVLIQLIERDISEIRALINQKILLVGEHAGSKFVALSAIEKTVKSLITRLDQFSPTGTGELSSDWERLSLLLNDEIDEGFRRMIQTALVEEKADVHYIGQGIDQAMHRQLFFAGLFAASTSIAIFLVVIMLNVRITKPINTLLQGVRKFGEGEYNFRVNLSGRDELAEIGSTFNTMAGRVAEKNQTLSIEKEALTNAVADRTERLSLMLEEVKRTDASRKRMIADVSHELRTPLTIIKGEADIALRGKEKQPVVYRDALTRVREAANHTTRLVDDLLFVARNEAGEVQLNLSLMDLHTVVDEARNTFGSDVPIESTVNTAPIQGDAGRIRQALLVLLENARHHGGDQIKLKIDSVLEGFRVAVEDTGPGMSDSEKSQAFERFFRGSNAAERYREGSGLGLPVALSIVQAHGGTITLEDRLGGGLSAAIHLPE